MTCGETIVAKLERRGVDTIFGIPGVHNLELYRGLEKSKIRHILTRHEQGAGFMADGYARKSGKVGVCFVISGPGVTNIATPLAQAYSDSSPVLLISSDAPSHSLGKGQGHLHEVEDLTAVTRPYTAFSQTIKEPKDILFALEEAFNVFVCRRPRPVHLAIPLDVLAADMFEGISVHRPYIMPQADPEDLARALEVLENSHSPLIVVGAGVKNHHESSGYLDRLANHLAAPVISSNAAKGLLPDSHPLSLGSRLGHSAGAKLLAEADSVLSLGAEFGRADFWSGYHEPGGRAGQEHIQIDIDPQKLDQFPEVSQRIRADAYKSLEDFCDHLKPERRATSEQLAASQERVAALKASEQARLEPLAKQHQNILQSIRRASSKDVSLVADMTQIAYSAITLWEAEEPNCWFFPTGYGTLGFALPAAIGVKMAAPEKEVVALVGDGGLQYTLQELGTAAEQGLAICIVLWNNQGLGEIARSLEAVDIEAKDEYIRPLNPDFVALAQAYHCHALRVRSADELEEAVRNSHKQLAPTLIEVMQHDKA